MELKADYADYAARFLVLKMTFGGDRRQRFPLADGARDAGH